jgi:ElaB/YqjD/DUF883 family membrane-anchored ribosome-binding protein
MTAPTDQFIDIAKCNQDAFNSVTRTWIDSIQSMTGNVGSGETAASNVHPYLDSLFDVAEKLLSNQRKFAHQWINAAVRATEAVTEQAARAAQSVSQPTANHTDTVVKTGAQARPGCRRADRFVRASPLAGTQGPTPSPAP